MSPANTSDGMKGELGDPGYQGERGVPGAKGAPGIPGTSSNTGSSVYIRWGRTTCPANSSLIYQGEPRKHCKHIPITHR